MTTPMPSISTAPLHHHSPIGRTLSESELSSYSSVSSVRDAIESAQRLRDSLRKSRLSCQALRKESRQALLETREMRLELQGFLNSSSSSSNRKSKKQGDRHFDHASGGDDHSTNSDENSEPSRNSLETEISDMTFESMTDNMNDLD